MNNQLWLLALATALMLSPGSAHAQAISGDVVGTLTDSSGASIPGADIEAQNSGTNVRTVTKTSGDGQYRFTNLPPGSYTITASPQGFTPTSVKNVTVDANKVVTVNLTAPIGKVSTTVEVTSAPTVIDTTTATIQNTFDTSASRDLPVSSIGIGVANLALLNAGVSSSNNLGAGEGPSVGGQRPYNNNFMVEGVDNNNKSVTGSLLRIFPNDAIAEFTVLQNQMSAEFGHSSGGQFNTIIKSGTNGLHGTFYEYLQNRNLNAIDQQVQNAAIANGEKPKNTRLDSNRFGGSIGGPILSVEGLLLCGSTNHFGSAGGGDGARSAGARRIFFECFESAIQITVAPTSSLFWCDAQIRRDFLIPQSSGGPQHNPRPLHQTRRQRTSRAICSSTPLFCLSSTTGRATRI